MSKTPDSLADNTVATTAGYTLQSMIAFAASFGATLVGVVLLPLDIWQRGFLMISTLFLVTSCFTLAKVVRDNHERSTVRVRMDEARLERLLAEHDPLRP